MFHGPLKRTGELLEEGGVLALNETHEAETSALDRYSLCYLAGQAFYIGLRDAGRVAFLIALDEQAEYADVNFGWFKVRYERFVYFDRVIVAERARGRGIARRLYKELFDPAKAEARPVIGCEVNHEPPNPAPDAFHAALNFREAGRARLGSGKLVRYLIRMRSEQSGM